MKTAGKVNKKEINFMQIGETIECGACHPEKYPDCEAVYANAYNGNGTPLKCLCKCHKNPSKNDKQEEMHPSWRRYKKYHKLGPWNQIKVEEVERLLRQSLQAQKMQLRKKIINHNFTAHDDNCIYGECGCKKLVLEEVLNLLK